MGVLALTRPAEAKIVYTPTHVKFCCEYRYSIDLNHDGISDFQLDTHYNTGNLGSYQSAWVGAAPYFTQSKNRNSGIKNRRGMGLALALKRGTLVDGKLFGSSGRYLASEHNGKFGTSSTGQWFNVKNRYLGLMFQIKGKTHYGWARLSVSTTHSWPPFSVLLTGYAYETMPNKAIIAGKTHGKDEATLGRLAQGASGISDQGKP